MSGLSMTIILLALLALPLVLALAPTLRGAVLSSAREQALRALINDSALPVVDVGAEQIQKTSLGVQDWSTPKQGEPIKTRSLSRRLVYAQWKITVLTYHLLEVAISAAIIVVTSPLTGLILKAFLLLSGPIIMRGRLNRSIDKRFKLFDNDFPQYLLSIIGLLKTGMSTINAIEVAAAGLDTTSLVRQEVQAMTDKMRVGIPEEVAIGDFGKTVPHAEIELFVQAMLLSRRSGGTLSDSLERLSHHARKRQYFRNMANAAVALQRASTWMIIGILVLLELYIYLVGYPALITECWKDPIGWMVWQGAIVVIFASLIWMKELTKIKV